MLLNRSSDDRVRLLLLPSFHDDHAKLVPGSKVATSRFAFFPVLQKNCCSDVYVITDPLRHSLQKNKLSYRATQSRFTRRLSSSIVILTFAGVIPCVRLSFQAYRSNSVHSPQGVVVLTLRRDSIENNRGENRSPGQALECPSGSTVVVRTLQQNSRECSS